MPTDRQYVNIWVGVCASRGKRIGMGWRVKSGSLKNGCARAHTKYSSRATREQLRLLTVVARWSACSSRWRRWLSSLKRISIVRLLRRSQSPTLLLLRPIDKISANSRKTYMSLPFCFPSVCVRLPSFLFFLSRRRRLFDISPPPLSFCEWIAHRRSMTRRVGAGQLVSRMPN